MPLPMQKKKTKKTSLQISSTRPYAIEFIYFAYFMLQSLVRSTLLTPPRVPISIFFFILFFVVVVALYFTSLLCCSPNARRVQTQRAIK